MALIAGEGEARVTGMLDNRTRTGFLDAAKAMGADVRAEEDGQATGEDTVRVIAKASRLKGIASRSGPRALDDRRAADLRRAGRVCRGETKVTGAAELRVKESDRIKAICAMLAVNGVAVEELADGFIVTGLGARSVAGGGTVEARHDHRIAMSALVMGSAAKDAVERR